jgi:hypothetical protein
VIRDRYTNTIILHLKENQSGKPMRKYMVKILHKQNEKVSYEKNLRQMSGKVRNEVPYNILKCNLRKCIKILDI